MIDKNASKRSFTELVVVEQVVRHSRMYQNSYYSAWEMASILCHYWNLFGLDNGFVKKVLDKELNVYKLCKLREELRKDRYRSRKKRISQAGWIPPELVKLIDEVRAERKPKWPTGLADWSMEIDFKEHLYD